MVPPAMKETSNLLAPLSHHVLIIQLSAFSVTRDWRAAEEGRPPSGSSVSSSMPLGLRIGSGWPHIQAYYPVLRL